MLIVRRLKGLAGDLGPSPLPRDVYARATREPFQVFASGRVSPPGSEVFASHGNHQVDQPPLAMMLCFNFLPMTVSEGLCAEEAFWMLHNVWKVTLDADARWWLDL